MLTDYHNHLERGTLTLDYLRQFTDEAAKKGIEHFGISEHAYHFYQTKNILSNPWVEARRCYDMADYVQLFHEAWDAGIDVKMSIEMDYTPGKHEEMAAFIRSYDFDYVIGSIHWVDDFGIDLVEYRREWERRDLYDTYRKYFDQVVTLAESNLFDIIGHLDLVKIFKYVPEDEEFLLEQYDRATTALANSKTCVEISTAGLRKPVGELYPDPRLLKMCYEKGIPIVFSSDAHVPEHVGADFDKAIELARSVGYTELMTFSKGERKAVPLG
ncbi:MULTISPECIES: histidinol-phosphatase [Geobacillus]|nr:MULTISPECIES: histidinol-phosphatase [Geobacillus]ARA99313.1 histidinol phosphatase [Geobacillus thermodenitrificans]ARP43292.1 putative histidinol-phosphatase [Geobacillus thermodenitrificans]ATO38612.1 histidinol phosphatase [Geobacillus thermodenitrificans]KQB92748.1 histidinol-phosphatase [Geobacillus sp. PA-3]MEC5187588.1 histidinol-phosphatase (PHP family) [Geobacillus thermodenitrificans]